MTQDEIIEMARRAGYDEHQAKFDTRIEAIAKLIAEKAFDEGYSIGELAGFKEGVKLERKIREQT